MRLYHGSTKIISTPSKNEGHIYNDYGQGFYCTEEIELAKEWAAQSKSGGFLNIYQLDTTGLTVLNLNASTFHILHWLTVLLEHRQVKLSSPVMDRGARFLTDHYHVEIHHADLIRGYRADDSYFSFVRAFLSNTIDVYQLQAAMKAGNLGEQVFLQSKKAFQQLHFLTAESVDGKRYEPLRSARDEQAREAYYQLLREEATAGIYLSDLMNGKVTEDELFI